MLKPFFMTRLPSLLMDVGHYEQRFLTIGMNIDHQLLVICYSYSEQDSLRIISARKADPSERRQYEEIDRF